VTRPVFVVVCGINGAGKSTLADALAGSPELARLPFLNPDRLSADYRVADPALSREAADIRALRHIAGEIRRLLAALPSVVSETVGANAAYRRYVEAAKTAGYLVRLVFVGLRSAEQSIARVALRISLGGHSISTPDIRRRWPAVHVNLTVTELLVRPGADIAPAAVIRGCSTRFRLRMEIRSKFARDLDDQLELAGFKGAPHHEQGVKGMVLPLGGSAPTPDSAIFALHPATKVVMLVMADAPRLSSI